MKKHMLGDAPIEPSLHADMNALARFMDEYLNEGLTGKDRKNGFVLLVFPFGPVDGRCNYISNGASREDVIVLMKEQIARFEGQPGEPLLIAKSAFRFHHLMLGVTGSRMFEQSGCPSLPPLPDSAEQCYIEIGPSAPASSARATW